VLLDRLVTGAAGSAGATGAWGSTGATGGGRDIYDGMNWSLFIGG